MYHRLRRFMRKHKSLVAFIKWLALIVGCFNIGPIMVKRDIASIHTLLLILGLTLFIVLDMKTRRR